MPNTRVKGRRDTNVNTMTHEIKIALLVLSIIGITVFIFWPDLFQDDENDRYY